jgi:glycosyltransferase involved in cell wall biosynthesis
MPRFVGSTPHLWRVDRRRPWSAVTALLDLRRTVRRLRPDVVHLHSFVAGFLGRLPGQQRWLGGRVPIVYQPHAWSFELFSRPAVGRAVRWSESRAVGNTDVMVTNGVEEVEEGRANQIELPAHTLGVAIDLDAFHPVSPSERGQLRERLGITAPHVLVCVGRLSRQKGQDLLLQAWERSRPADTQLVLVGPGDPAPLREHAPTQWGATVLAVGEQVDVRPWLWASDALVLSSRYETVAVVVAEAMACGRPVVATAVNGAAVTITEGPLAPAGAVVALGDMAALIREASRRLTDGALADREADSGRRRAEQLFRPGLIASRLEHAYRDAIAKHRQRDSSG